MADEDRGRVPEPDTKQAVQLPEGVRKGGDVIDDSTPPAARPHQMLDQAQPVASQTAPESGEGSGGDAG